MMELMVVHPHIFWLSLGGLLLAAEMLGGNGYLLWSGVAAVITGLVVWLVPLGWEWQGVMFAVLTLLAAWLWWKWLSRRVREQKHSDSHLNQRGQQLIGRRLCWNLRWSTGEVICASVTVHGLSAPARISVQVRMLKSLR